MLIYNGLKSDFMADTENDVLETKLYDTIKQKMNRSTGLSELNSWRNSLKEMYITLNDSAIPSDAGVAIEYNKFSLSLNIIRKCYLRCLTPKNLAYTTVLTIRYTLKSFSYELLSLFLGRFTYFRWVHILPHLIIFSHRLLRRLRLR